MIFKETPLAGAYLIELEKRSDERGFFARVFCRAEFSSQNLASDIVQMNNSLATEKGTLRGMHYQLLPKSEVKIVRCIRGALLDVIIDLREDSPTFLQHFGVRLTAEKRNMLYVPKQFAHGFLTLEDNTETLYFVDEPYAPDFERGIRWNDPGFGIDWPLAELGLTAPAVISEKDGRHPDFDPATHLR